MPIPNAIDAQIADEKLTSYLLNESHPVGGPKARWFISRGYHASSPARLRADLNTVVCSSEDFSEEMTLYGAKYIVRGELECPDGSRPGIITVWITEVDSAGPRFVTAYPDEAL